MEVTEIKAFVDQMHKNYLEMANSQLIMLEQSKDMNLDYQNFLLKKATEYVNKAAGIEKGIDFIYNH